MHPKNRYSRKISKKEAENDFIFILKNKLSFFPPLYQDFFIDNGEVLKKVKVESYPCTCRGPDLPHEHYFIKCSGLKKGVKVEIEKDQFNQDQYVIKISS
jgi:hypothetical protein